jgi:hypothetical protein
MKVDGRENMRPDLAPSNCGEFRGPWKHAVVGCENGILTTCGSNSGEGVSWTFFFAKKKKPPALPLDHFHMLPAWAAAKRMRN